MLNTQPNFTDADGFYESLIAAHQDLSTAQSQALNARLVLLLANHIGDNVVLQEALNAARAADTTNDALASSKASSR